MLSTPRTPEHRRSEGPQRAPAATVVALAGLAALALLVLPACADTEASPGADATTGAETAPVSSVAASPATAASTPIYADGQEAPEVEVWKAPTCGCCGAWVEHLEAAGFRVQVNEVSAMGAVKTEHGIASEHQSCHTALVDGYLVEGHVPADAIARMLDEEPDIRGLAVPGMPVGSPGMEVGDRKDPYDVLALMEDGSAVVYDRR